MDNQMRNIRSVARKELVELRREKTFLLSVLIQLFIASFSTFLVIGLTSFYDPTIMKDMDMQSVSIAVVGTEDNELYKMISESKLTTHIYPELTSAYTDFYKHKVDAIVIAPTIPPDGTEIMNVEVYLPKAEIKATLISLQIKEPLEKFEQYVRDIRTQRLPGYSPLEIHINKSSVKTSSTYFEFIYVALIPLLVFTPAFISGGLIIDFITEEFERKTMELLLVTPASPASIMSGKILVAAGIVPLQALAWMLLLSANMIQISNFSTILLVVTLIGTILVLLSCIISMYFRDRGVAQLLYSLVLIFLFMASYMFTNSPLNLVTRLSIDSIGLTESITWIGIYALVALALGIVTREAVKNI